MKRLSLLIFTGFLMVSCGKNSQGKTSESVKTQTDTLKQKDGSVLSFQKLSKPLVAMKRDQTNYSEAYEKRLGKLAEYYIAGSQRSLVKYHLTKPESVLGYSYEENEWEGVNYTQIGIFNKSGSNLSTLQWLFYEPKSQKLYEFDLNTKKLQEFR